MPMFWGDYDRDTGELFNDEHGAYQMLIKHYWCSGRPIRDDNDRLWHLAKCRSIDDWLKIRPIIAPFFKIINGFWHHKRVDLELEDAAKRYAKRVEAARSTNANRDAKRAHSELEASVDRDADRTAERALRARASQPQPQPHSSNEESPTRRKRRFEYPEIFLRFWKAFPHRGKAQDNKRPAWKSWERAVKDGIDPETIIRGADGYRTAQSGKDPEYNQMAVTWLNQAGWEQYAAASEAPAEVTDEVWLRRLAKYPIDRWPKFLGPAPGNDGCLVPSRLLKPPDAPSTTDSRPLEPV